MRIPAPDAGSVELRLASLGDRDRFGERWRYTPLVRGDGGDWEVDLAALDLADGAYEYEFVLDGNRSAPVADPWGKEITRFGGYRGLLHIRDGQVWSPPFDWSDELPPGTILPENNRIVVYEMPLRWMEGDTMRQVGLGTFEKVVFAHLNLLANAGINCIELLPVQDSPDTLKRIGRTSGPMLAAEPVEASCNRAADGRSRATLRAELLPAAVVRPVNLCI